MPTAHQVEVPSPQAPGPPAPSPPLPPDGQACPEATEAVARANEAGGLEEDDAAVGLSTPKQVMTPRVLTDVNESNAVSTEEGEEEDDQGEDGSLSDDESYTPSVGEEEDEDDDDTDQTQWKAQAIKSRDFSVGFNVTDRLFEEKYLQETLALTKRLRDEFAAISHNPVRKDALTEDELLNTYFPAESAVPVLAFMNRNLLDRKMTPITFPELEPFLRAFFGLCYYKCKIADIKSHPEAHPPVADAVNNLVGNTFDEKIERLNNLLRSFDGHDVKRRLPTISEAEECLTYAPNYGIDRELEKLLRDLGGHASRLAYIEGVTDGMIDDEKTRGRSAKAAALSLARSKSTKAYGPVGNCINSMFTGIPLATHYSHFKESSTDIVMANLCIITGATSQKTVDMKGSLLGGDRGYNDNEYFEQSAAANMENVHTTKRGPSLAFTFGKTKYKTTRDQREISESGPPLSLGATRAVGGRTSYMTAYRNGTSRVTLLQTTLPTMSYGKFDYVTEYEEFDYAKSFEKAASSDCLKDGYDPVERLSERDAERRFQHDAHNVYEQTKRTNGIEWQWGRKLTISSTVGNEVLPKKEDDLTPEQKTLLRDDLGKKLISALERDELEEYSMYVDATPSELEALRKEKLIEICKKFKQPYSGRTKPELIKQIQKGPLEVDEMTEQEMFLKKTFLVPLADKDKSAWKLGSLNEDNVRRVMKAVVKGVGGELEDMWESGLLRNKSHHWLATSLDGWLRIKVKASEARVDEDINNDDVADDDDESIPPEWEAPPSDPNQLVSINCGLEIKTPSGAKVLREKVMPAKDLYGTFSTCEFGSQQFKTLVYDSAYRVQVLHHATAANLSHVLFVVASETGIRYATLVHIPKNKRLTYLSILQGVYERCLKWAYEDAWESDDPVAHIPVIRPDVISSSNYPIDEDCIVVAYCIWKILLKKVRAAQLPLPRAKKILPVIITFWNRAKGRIDEMTRHLDSMLFELPRGSPKQRLVMREIMKLGLSVYFSKKHCFPSKPIPKGQGYSKIQQHLWHLGKVFTLKEVLYKLATTYTVRNQIKGFIPGSPMPGKSTNDDDDESNGDVEPTRRGLSSWQSQALAYIRGMQNKRYKFNLFCKDELLERIRLDTKLNHSQVSLSTINSGKKRKPSSAKQTSGKKRKASDEEDKDKEEEKEEEEEEEEGKEEEEMETEESSKQKQKKKKYYPSNPRCVLCQELLGAKAAHQTAYACRTCGVPLCIKTHGQNQKSCFEKWHSVTNLAGLRKNNSAKPAVKPVRMSPRKIPEPSASGLITTSDGRRSSARRKVQYRGTLV